MKLKRTTSSYRILYPCPLRS